MLLLKWYVVSASFKRFFTLKMTVISISLKEWKEYYYNKYQFNFQKKK